MHNELSISSDSILVGYVGRYHPMKDLENLIKSFNKALLAVCEGQALDKEFENKQNINEEEYFNMIEKKTSHLIKKFIFFQ